MKFSLNSASLLSLFSLGSMFLGVGRLAGREANEASMFRGDSRHTGFYDRGSVPTASSVDLSMKWRFKTQGKIRSTPATADGLVFIGSEDGNLYAVSATTGLMKWKLQIGGDISSSPALVGSVVLIVGGDQSLYAVDRSDGHIIWKRQTGPFLKFEAIPGDPRIFDYYNSSPTVVDDRIYFGSSDGHVYAVNLKDGTILWKFNAGHWVHCSPAVADGLVYFGNYDGDFFALDAQSGQLRWTYKVDRWPGSPFPVTLVGSPAVADGIVYFASNNPTYVNALDAKTGERKWRVEHPGSMIYSSPAIANGLVFVGSSDAQILQALDSKTGVEKWHADTKARVLTSPIVADGLVYAGNTEAYLTVHAITDGKQVGMTYTEASIHSSPVSDGGMLYVGSDDNHLYAFEKTLHVAESTRPAPASK